MSIGRSKEEQELTQLLAKTLVQKEVMEPMDKIGWSHGTPPPPDYTTTQGAGQPGAEGAPGQPKPAAPAPSGGQPASKPTEQKPTNEPPKADTPDINALIAGYEALRDPETGLIARKYKTVDEAIKGGVHLTHMTKQAFKERDDLLARVRELESRQGQAPAAAPAAAAPQPKPTQVVSRATLDEAQARLDKVLSDITENGGVLDAESSKALSAAQRGVADAAAEVRVQEMFASRSQEENADKADWAKVDAYMKEHHPAAERFSEEVAVYMQSDPLLASAVNALLAQGNKVGATELAWVSFERAHGEQVAAADRAKAEDKEADLAAREQVRKEQVEKARKDAGVITGSAGGAGGHEKTNAGGASREEIQAAVEAMRREGDAPGSPAAMRFRAMVIGPSLDPSIFGPR